MTLRRKTLLIVLVTLAFLMSVVYLVTHNLMDSSFSAVEESIARRNVERAKSALYNDIDTLNMTVGDWAVWDDTYKFIQDHNQAYVRTNLVSESSFIPNKLNIIVFLDTAGNVVYGKGYDLKAKKELPVPISLLRGYLNADSPMVKLKGVDSSVSGIVALPEGAMLVASRPIITSRHEGPVRGTLVMGRYLDAIEVEHLSTITRQSVMIRSVDDQYMPPDFKQAMAELASGGPTAIRPEDQDFVAGYTMLKDIAGKPRLILKTLMYRDVFKQWQVGAFYNMLFLLAAGIIFGFMMLNLLERLILARLAGLSEEVSEIGEKSDFSARVAVDGHDEVSGLAIMINDMLGALENSSKRLKESETRYKELVDSLPISIFEIDEKGVLTLVNSMSFSMFGYSREQFEKGIYLADLVVPEDRGRAIENMRRVMEGECLGNQEYLALRRDGTVFPVVMHCSSGNGVAGARSVVIDVGDIKKTQEALRESEEKYRTILENIEDAYFEVDLAGNITFLNDVGYSMTGYSREELLGSNYRQYTVSEEVSRIYGIFNKIYTTGQPAQLFDWIIIRKDGNKRYLEASVSLIKDVEGTATGFRALARDVTDRKKVEEKLRESEEKYRLVFENSPLGILHFDRFGYITACNSKIEEIVGIAEKKLVGVNLLSLPDHRLATSIKKALSGRHSHYESDLTTVVPGRAVPVKADFAPIIIDDSTIIGGVIIVENITERKLAEKQLKYLSFHDSLTGLYNRAYFEQEMRRLDAGRNSAVGIIICDVDGLKLVNDTMGHDKGDLLLVEAAGVISDSFRGSDVVARIGGDEFAVLISGSPRLVVEEAFKRIKRAIISYNEENPDLPLSMSVGFAFNTEENIKMTELFKEADNSMYREKLHSSQSARSSIVQTLMKALEARDFITEGHADRIQKLVAGMAASLGMTDRRAADLRLLAQFHDIGKVGIPDRILFKSGPLTSEEWNEMKRHSEIGHRIALSAPELAPVANWILKHHEYWDGSGYPLGLKGDQIPMECRILAIADAYDAMISDRPYRKAVSHAEAIAELKRCSGKQFDPVLLEKFIDVLEEPDKL